MTTSEKRIETAIRDCLENLGYLTYKIHVGKYGPKGFPDLIVVKKGITSYLEVKKDGKEPSLIQQEHIKDLREAGCIADRVRSVDDTVHALRGNEIWVP